MGDPKTGDYINRQQVGHTIFSNKNYSTNFLERMLLYNKKTFTIAHILGKNNKRLFLLARDLSEREINTTDHRGYPDNAN